MLFHAARAGHVRVLVGSTEMMGVGTSIQPRALALHHLDCSWRPADIEQREGRILRRGNHPDEVQILRYVVERSFDAYRQASGVSVVAELRALTRASTRPGARV